MISLAKVNGNEVNDGALEVIKTDDINSCVAVMVCDGNVCWN